MRPRHPGFSVSLAFVPLAAALLFAPGPLRATEIDEPVSGRELPLATVTDTSASRPNGVPERRLARLRRGINTSHWFAQVVAPRGYTKEHFESHTTAEDLALIKSLGFDHLRLSVDPWPMLVPGQADRIPAEYLGYLDRAVEMILAQDLAVIVDIHPSSEFKRKLQMDDRQVEALADFWRALAWHFSSRDPERVFLEVLNEPEFEDGYRWSGVQAKLVAAIRQGAPSHTIIATGHRWSAVDELLFLEPLRDPNVVYSFHFYVPHLFTHQGATWGVNFWHYLKEVPYPSSPDAISRLAVDVPDELSRLHLIRYGHGRWDMTRIEAEIAQVVAWARKHGVRVTCNEFGVYRKFTNPAHRASWIADVRTVLERHGIGWTMWDYAGDFGVVTKEAGTIVLDEPVVNALGLRAVPHSPRR